MAIPGLFVEYLVTGAIALLWLYPFLKGAELWPQNSSLLPLLAIGLYVIGMMIDLSSILLYPIKRLVRKMVAKRRNVTISELQSGSDRKILFAFRAPEIAKEVAMRSSRDRIARGTFINLFLAAIIPALAEFCPRSIPSGRILPIWLSCLLIIFSSLMWIVFESASYSYELRAWKVLKGELDTARKDA